LLPPRLVRVIPGGGTISQGSVSGFQPNVLPRFSFFAERNPINRLPPPPTPPLGSVLGSKAIQDTSDGGVFQFMEHFFFLRETHEFSGKPPHRLWRKHPQE